MPKLDHEKNVWEVLDEAEGKGYASTAPQTVVVKSEGGAVVTAFKVPGNMTAAAVQKQAEEATGISFGPGTGGMGKLLEFEDESCPTELVGSGEGGPLHPIARAGLGLVPAASQPNRY